MKTFARAAVLGSGTMGSRIAAHLANAGVPSLVLDVAPARGGIEAALKAKPAAFFTPDLAGSIETGSFETDLHKLVECDLVLEAVVEHLEIKRGLYARVMPHLAPDAILATNTSGIRLAEIARDFPDDVKRRFLGAHFFNPPRYLHLAELIPLPETAPETLARAARFVDLRLGKGVVIAKDTPNFIANRIGAFFGATVQMLTAEFEFTCEEADELTGPLIGIPKSASFRLLDIVGIDVWDRVIRNLHDAVPNDPFRARFTSAPFVEEMVRRGWLGEKTGQGCYRRAGRAFEALDWRTMEYRPAAKPRSEAQIEPLAARLRTLIASDDASGRFLWRLLSDHILYAAHVAPEIAEHAEDIDRAMRWGYAHELGPFEMWDALGFETTARRIQSEGRALPELVERMLSAGVGSFARAADRDSLPRTEYVDFSGAGWREVADRPGVVSLIDLRRARGVVREAGGASLIDLGDGVLCCELHSKMNTIGEGACAMLQAGIDELAANFDAMLIAGRGANFSVGANLKLIVAAAESGRWDEIERFIAAFQQLNMAIRYSLKPVVAATAGLTLGGGCEIALHCARQQASAELYAGLVEAGVGLIPGGGGCKEMVVRGVAIKQVFEQIGFAKVSSSAAEARRFGYLRETDGVSMNPERLLGDAKRLALAIAPGYAGGAPRSDIEVGGESLYAALKLAIRAARQGGYISRYDAEIAEKLAYVLSGGRLAGKPVVSEQHLLDLEREAFLGLCGRQETLDRIRHTLATGKPLRN